MTAVATTPSREMGHGPVGNPYGTRVTRALPALRRAFLGANRYLAVPLLRAGLGPLFSTPWTGSLMVLRTRGRRTGVWRDAPLGYLIRDGSIYCCAGFGPTTHWFRNLRADPRAEVLLPGRSLSGLAEVVTEPAEQVPVMRELLGSMFVISRPLVGDMRRKSDEEVAELARALPLVRVRVNGVAAGPWDPGGTGWIVPTALTALGMAWLAGRALGAALHRTAGVPT